jgi:threonine aldolase
MLAPVEANAVFVDLPQPAIDAMRAKGWRFYNFVGATGVRFMCSWDTTAASVDALVADLRVAMRS